MKFFWSLFLCLTINFVFAQEDKKDEKKEKSYTDVITDEAISQTGLISTHQVGDKYYFEIPDSLLEKEILVVSRISGFVKGLNFGGAGVKSRPQQVIRFQKKDKKILLRSVSYNSVASEEKPIYESVKNNNFEPIIDVFSIEVEGKNKDSYVIDVGGFFTSDIDMIGPMYNSQRKNFGIKSLDKSRSFIQEIKSFPQNVLVKHVLTYNGGDDLPDNQLTGTLSVEMTQSFILLPSDPWPARQYDDRVGFFSIRQTDYGLDAQRAESRRYITRWRLEPSDWAAYNRGELVEPVTPIVYYIDPATPTEWVPYLKAGVEDWNVAFEKAGFKNAIMAKEAPSKEEDPDWDPNDVRYSVIRYVSTDIQNAMGPHVHDPRTGQILESDIIWYHNVMNLLRNWYFIQTAAINPEARHPKFRKEVMGRLIRFVSAHEVGHTLGLPHNMGSSVAYPVDSLRSPSFTKKMGTAPSIMDYARFNYVAQPEDGDVGLMPDVGPYDKYSIEFGYRLYEGKNTDTERTIINDWIIDHADDPIFRYGRQQRNVVDHTAQTEDLGADAIKASDLGIENLKRIVPNLIDWTSEETKDFSSLEELYGQASGQFRRYIGHVTNNIGGVKQVAKSTDQNEGVYTPAPYEKQKRAIAFLGRQVFTTPSWFFDKDILDRIGPEEASNTIQGLHSYAIRELFEEPRLSRIDQLEVAPGVQSYGLDELFSDSYVMIFGNSITNPTDPIKRQLQETYVDKMIQIVKSSDYPQNAKAEAFGVLQKVLDGGKKWNKISNPVHRNHIGSLVSKINRELD